MIPKVGSRDTWVQNIRNIGILNIRNVGYIYIYVDINTVLHITVLRFAHIYIKKK